MNLREWALPFYTILMQLAVGALLVLWILRWWGGRRFNSEEISRVLRNPLLIISFTVVVAMLAAHLHLSRPLLSFYAVRNFRSSWLSREIVFTVAFFLTLSALLFFSRFKQEQHRLITLLGWLAVALGLMVVYCMAMIYLLPTQLAWNSNTVIVSFYTTTLILGSLAIICLMVLDLKFSEIQKANDIELRSQMVHYSASGLTGLAIVLVILSLVISYIQVRFLGQGGVIARMSLQLLIVPYLPLFLIRLVVLIAASVYLLYAVIRMYRLKTTPQSIILPVYLSCLLIIIGEIIGRFLFYAVHIRVGV